MNEGFIDDLIIVTRTRQTGKTELLRIGIKNYDKPFILVCCNLEQGKLLTNGNPNAIYVTTNVANTLKGRYRLPIIFDQEIVLDYLHQIRELQTELNLLKRNVL